MPRGRICYDHLETKFNSISQMAKSYGLTQVILNKRIKRGWTLEQALVTPNGVPLNKGNEQYDHLGNKFSSLKAMAKAYNKDTRSLGYRLNSGWSIEDALTKDYAIIKGKECKDHLGNSYISIKEMCEAYGIEISVLYGRKKSKWTLERSLTTPVGEDSKCKDHLGNEYQNVVEMCKAYNIDNTVFNGRMRHNWKLERALTESVISSNTVCRDHNGEEYNSVTDMCKSYKVNVKIYESRIKRGWNKEKALTSALVDARSKCEDTFGNKYSSIDNMLNEYDIKRSAYYSRLKLGWTLGEALGLNGKGLKARVRTTFKGLTFEKFLYTGRNKLDYYLCSSRITGKEIILNEKNWVDYVEIKEK